MNANGIARLPDEQVLFEVFRDSPVGNPSCTHSTAGMHTTTLAHVAITSLFVIK